MAAQNLPSGEGTLEALVDDRHAIFAAAFDEWLRQWQEEPEAFTRIEDCEAGSYGERCAHQLARILGELEEAGQPS